LLHGSDLSASEYKHILRIAGKDIDGSKKLIVALSEVKGVGYNFAQVLTQSLKISPDKRVGFLTESELREIEEVIANPSNVGIPQWYSNRRKDMETGATHHIITSDLDFASTHDVEREKLVMSWRGYRHMFGLRVRGQCTRTTGRKGGAVGVKKIKAMPGAAPGAPSGSTGATPTAVGAGAAPSTSTVKPPPSPAGSSAKPSAPGKEPAKK